MKPSSMLSSFLTIILALVAGLVGGGAVSGLTSYGAFHAPAAAASNDVPTPTVAPTDAPAEEPVVRAIRQVSPAVVAILKYGAPSPGQLDYASAIGAYGSGLVFDPSGLIVTNNHVVEGARLIQVFFADGTSAEATLLGADPATDIAVVQVNGPVPAAVPLEGSRESKLGETVIAIGSPLDQFRGSATAGVVSGLNRSVGGLGGLIQTDAALNAGNSGGPLVNTSGQVIGINTLVVRTTTDGRLMEGLGFALPAQQVSQMVTRLIARAHTEPAYIGVEYEDMDALRTSDDDLAMSMGVLVIQVEAGGPAALAGLQTKDIILEIGGQGIDQNHVFPSLLRDYKPGDTMTLTVFRGQRQMHLTVVAGRRPS